MYIHLCMKCIYYHKHLLFLCMFYNIYSKGNIYSFLFLLFYLLQFLLLFYFCKMDHFLTLQFSYIYQFQKQKNIRLYINGKNLYIYIYQLVCQYNFHLGINLIYSYYILDFQNNNQNDNHFCIFYIFVDFPSHKHNIHHKNNNIHPNISLFHLNKNQNYLKFVLFLQYFHNN